MPTDITVDRATVRDAEGIHRVAKRAWRATYEGILDDATISAILDSGYAAGSIEDLVTSDRTAVFVARRDGEVVGYATHGEQDVGQVGNLAIYVDPDEWGSGIGERLLERAAEQMRERGKSRIRDAVLADNDVGNAFYEKHFETAGEETVRVGGDEYAANVYEREL